MTKLQDISFIFNEDINHNSSFTISSHLLHNYLINQFRNNKLFKKYYSENFNLIHTLKHKDINIPYDVKTNQKFIFVGSLINSRVCVFHRLTREHFTNIEISEVTCPVIALDPNNEDDLYIGGYKYNYICIYRYNRVSSTFEFIKKFNGNFNWVTNIVIDKQLIYCPERDQNKISILNKENGQLVREIKNEYTTGLWGLTLFDKDYFFLTNSELKSVSKFSLFDGKLIKSYKGIDGVAGMVVNDKTNHLLVCSFKMKKLFILDCNSLELIRQVDCDFSGIITVDIDCDENLYISDNHSSEIKIFN